MRYTFIKQHDATDCAAACMGMVCLHYKKETTITKLRDMMGTDLKGTNLIGLSKCAEELGFKKSSVSIAMKNLREKNQITVTDAGFIYLTDEGRAIAEMIYERHELLSKGLVALGVDPKVATEDACRIEHVISAESFAAIKKHLHLPKDAE